MDYRDQERYFRGSRLWGGICVIALIASGLWSAAVFRMLGGYEFAPRSAVIQGMVLIAIAVSLYYTPDYLHLSINAEKTKSWALKVRWRIVAAVLVLGLAGAETNGGRMTAVIAAVALLIANHLATRLPAPYLPAFYWISDILFLNALRVFTALDALTVCFLAAAAGHFSLLIVRDERRLWQWWFIAVLIVAMLNGWALASSEWFSWVRGLPVLTAILGTEFLRRRAIAHHRRDREAALQELVAYSGKSATEVEALWRDSNRLLAENWKAAKLDENDHAAVKEWYRQNSGLYLYAISGHNLEYKKLVANMRMLRLAKGACLDYGAGNGELVLELAARGHAATYFDVDGETLRFARWRAQQRKLDVSFATTKEELRPGLDTIFSFDVLEHVPDLPGELTFLSSLLAKGGLLVCDVPAGATKNHPMHLNHHLNVGDHLRTKGLRERRTLWQRLTAREKYIFQA